MLGEQPQVFIVDDDPAVRNLLVSIFQRDGFNVVCFAEGESLLKALARHSPHCIILDIHLPGKTGLDLLAELNDRGSNIPIFIVSGQGDIQTAVQAIKGGALEFIEKPFKASQILQQVRKGVATQGSKSVVSKYDKTINFHFPGKEPLTLRERDVLTQLASGASNKEVGKALAISSRTVEVHRARIIKKLGAKNFADLLRMVFDENRS